MYKNKTDRIIPNKTKVKLEGEYGNVSGVIVGTASVDMPYYNSLYVVELDRGVDLVRDGENLGYASLILAHRDNISVIDLTETQFHKNSIS